MAGQRVKRSLFGLVLFSLLFLVFVGGGALLISGPQLAWGDGAGPVSSRPISKFLMVLPLIVFFGGGIAASLSIHRELRVFIALAAHGLTFLLFLFGSRENVVAGFVSGLIFFVLFAVPWWIVIRSNSAP
jgi:hypothetical protein